MSVAALDSALGALWIDVLRHLWQSALVLLPLFFAARVLRTAPASWSHRLWLAALLKLFVPLAVFGPWVGASPVGGEIPGFQTLVNVFGAGGVSASSSVAERIPAPFWLACTAAYAVIAGAYLIRTGRDLAAARRLAQHPVPVSGDRAAHLASALERAGLDAARVVISGSNLIPAVVGTLRPRIVVPRLLLDEMDIDELAAVLLHEDMHRRHADPAIALLQRLTTSLLFFFPLLGPLQRRIREAAELRCDEGALRAGAQPSAYARALARTIQLGLDPSPAPAALGDGNPSLVARRIERLKEPGRRRIMLKHRFAMGFAVALLAAGIFLPVTPPGVLAGPGANDEKVTMPELLHKVDAVYPKEAVKARAEGFVVLAATVNTDGTVGDVEVVRHADGWPSLDQAAIDAVRQRTYKPALKDGVPVATQLHLKVQFSLRKGTDDDSATFQ